jgi:TfoX/Sxy family transcriptional regulator of competence genes
VTHHVRRDDFLEDGVQLRQAGSLAGIPSTRDRMIAPMAYDEALADRIRDLIQGQRGVTEKKMFGGLAFLIGGNMAIAASGEGGALVRVDPAETDHLIGTTAAEAAVMRGRPMQGWLRVASEDLRTARQLATWVELGSAYAASLPPKDP